MNRFKEGILTEFESVLKELVGFIPKILQIIVFVFVAWLITKILLFVIKKILVKVQVDKWSEKLKDTKIFGNTTINVVLSKIILGVFKWFLILMFVMVGANLFGLDSISDGIRAFFAYLPRLITALAIFAGGIYLGTVVKKSLATMFKSLDINGGKLVGTILFYLIVVFTSITALDQAGIDTSIIKQNVTLIIGSILLAFTIAFGLGAREAVTRLLYGYYSRKNIQIGAKVKIDDVEGIVLAIDNICVTISTASGKVVLPIKDVVDTKVEVLSTKSF